MSTSSRLFSPMLLAAVLMLVITGCAAPQPAQPTPAPTTVSAATETMPSSALPTLTLTATSPAAQASATPRPTRTPLPTPTTITVINPLTGEVVPPDTDFSKPPTFISISNAPPTTRPQVGLSFSPLIFELFLGAGDTRFLALMQDYTLDQIATAGSGEETRIEPVRSGRLPYETLRKIYNAHLVFAGASDRVLPHMNLFQVALNNRKDSINTGGITVAELRELQELDQQLLGNADYTGNVFDNEKLVGGKKATDLWMFYHYMAQVFWRYNEEDGSYHRFQDDGEGTPLREFTDRLTGDPLTIENLVVLFAPYHFYDKTFFDIELAYNYRGPALLFRDGEMYPIYWTTRSDTYEKTTGRTRPIRFIDYDGNPIPLKVGQTFVEIVNLFSTYYEARPSEQYFILTNYEQPGSGFWAVKFYMPEYEPYKGTYIPLNSTHDD